MSKKEFNPDTIMVVKAGQVIELAKAATTIALKANAIIDEMEQICEQNESFKELQR